MRDNNEVKGLLGFSGGLVGETAFALALGTISRETSGTGQD